MVHVEYADGRLFIFPDFLQENIDTNKIFLEIIELTNPTYRFGKGKIGVGTEKSVIEQVYRSSYQGLQQDVYGQYFLEDGNCLLDFYFDDRDIVNRIRVSKAEIMHGTQGWKKVEKY